MLRSKKGFTLVELIVTVVIVGILAAVAMPMMTGNLNKARRSEAMAGCGALRTAARMYFAETRSWPSNRDQLLPYVSNNDLLGSYYTAGSYTVNSTWIQANGTPGWVNLNMNTGNMTDG